MAQSAEDFQKDLRDSIFLSDPKLDRKELLTDIFKAYTAKLFELVLSKSGTKNRMTVDGLAEIKNTMISEFRKAELGEHQQSVEWYEDMFDSTVQEILNDAALAHQGVDNVQLQQKQLEINPDAYIKEGGLYVPEHMKNSI